MNSALLRNYLVSALRNLAHNKLFSIVNIVGLAVGLAAAILIVLFVRDEMTYDSFIPGHERTYNIYTVFEQPGRKPLTGDSAQAASTFVADFPRAFPGIEAIARLAPVGLPLKRGDVEAGDRGYWADEDIFSVIPLPVVAGDLKTALAAPDGIVMTHRMARKYFGSEQIVGQAILLDGHPMRVTAVLEDFPSNTNLTGEIFAAGKADFSLFAQDERGESQAGKIQRIANIFVRLKPGASVDDIARGMPAFLKARTPQEPGKRFTFELVPLTQVHLHASDLPTLKIPDDKLSVYGIGLVGLFIPLIAVINFVNLMTARATRRGREVGIRKVSGATRKNLFGQFVGEAALYVAFGFVLALCLVELLLPVMNAALQRDIAFSYWRDPAFAGTLLLGGMAVAILAGTYPALVLSGFHPREVLHGGESRFVAPASAREILVVLQFSILIFLLLATGIMARQMQFALGDGLGVNTARTVMIMNTDCRQALKDRIESLSRVTATTCSSFFALNLGQEEADMTAPNGMTAGVYMVPADANFLSFYGARLVAGRLLSEERGQDVSSGNRSLVLNQRAIQRLGFVSADAAIGQSVRWHLQDAPDSSFTIVGVVRDFNFKTVREPVDASGYFVDAKANAIMQVRFAGGARRDIFAGIDKAWNDLEPAKRIQRNFVGDLLLLFYGDVIRQGVMLGLLAIIATSVACLGLFGLAAFNAERRVKEIGIRKAMGADKGSIVLLLLWQFAKPVLWASLIAWPLGYFAMTFWLNGFTYRVALGMRVFLGATLLALVIALLTIAAQAFVAARAKPAMALAYE